MITRALGVEPTVEVDARVVGVLPGDTFILCSDGLSGVVPHDEIAEILRAHVDPDEAVQRLVASANARGGPDNVTAIVLRWEPTSRVAQERAAQGSSRSPTFADP